MLSKWYIYIKVNSKSIYARGIFVLIDFSFSKSIDKKKLNKTYGMFVNGKDFPMGSLIAIQIYLKYPFYQFLHYRKR